MADLRIDLDQLATLQSRLGRIRNQFDDADQFGSDVSHAVGTIGELPYRVGAFASSWNDTRNGLMKNISTLSDAVESIRETFEDLDRMLATEADELEIEIAPITIPVYGATS